MKDAKVDHSIDEHVCLGAVLVYSREFDKDWIRMRIPNILNTFWSMKTSPPVAYMDYLELLHQTGHQLEDASNFRN